MKVLLLDDNQNRIQDIEKIIYEYNSVLITSHSLEDAKNKLKRESFDIVIVDLLVPKFYGNKGISSVAGFEFVKYIYETNDTITRPTGVIVVSTNFNDIDYIEELKLYPISLVDTNSILWHENFKNALDNIWTIINPIDIAIVTAVDVEFRAIFDDSWAEDLCYGLFTFYRKEYISSSGKKISAVLVQCENKGLVSAGLTVSTLFNLYTPDTVAMIGVAAGNPNKTKFGDIIVATQASDYSFGAIVDGEDNILQFESEPAIVDASESISRIFKKYCYDESIAYSIRRAADKPQYTEDINIIYGLIASGSQVVKSKFVTNEYIRPYNRNYIGIDMETYAIYKFCQKFNCPNFISLKSVSDHGDKNKTHEHQQYCAKLATKLLEHYIFNDYCM